MNSTSLAQGLRAALAGHEGSPLYRCALDALNAYARLGAACSDLRLSLPLTERGLLTEFGETVFDDGRDFAVAWNAEPGEEKPDVFKDATVQEESQAERFYWIDARRSDHPGNDSLTLIALRLVPVGHVVVDIERGEIPHGVTEKKPYGEYGEPLARLWIDRRPRGTR